MPRCGKARWRCRSSVGSPLEVERRGEAGRDGQGVERYPWPEALLGQLLGNNLARARIDLYPRAIERGCEEVLPLPPHVYVSVG
jgi:hypothetical protein